MRKKVTAPAGKRLRRAQRLRQDLALDATQLGTRLDADFVYQHAASALEGVERVGLAPGEEQRGHQLAPPALAVRILAHQAFDVAEQILVLAERESRVDQIFLRGPDHPLEAACIAGGERQAR